jgi:hypothetical protein
MDKGSGVAARKRTGASHLPSEIYRIQTTHWQLSTAGTGCELHAYDTICTSAPTAAALGDSACATGCLMHVYDTKCSAD